MLFTPFFIDAYRPNEDAIKSLRLPMLHLRENTPLYGIHEMQYAAITPLRAIANASKNMHRSPFNPLSYTKYGKNIAAALDVMERITHRYAKPEFGITETTVNGKKVPIIDEVVDVQPFCELRHFRKEGKVGAQPQLLIVAPMSGHHATLLRGTVESLLPFADVYITDWIDARNVAAYNGPFALEDYVSYVIRYMQMLGPDVHALAVCQPAVPVMMAVSIMNAAKDPCCPRSMILIGGPIDTRVNPTKVNETAANHTREWFESHVITRVPFNYPGFLRRVYPGFLQLSGFVSMNMQRHIDAHFDYFEHLVEGDGESADSHRKFYDEYLSVSDLPAEFYLDSIEQVFQHHLLPRGLMKYTGRKVDPGAITKTALLTLEGELDDISGVGQTKAAHALCKNLPASKHRHHMQKGVGHYGIFNGRKFREHVVPIIVDFMKRQGK